MEQFGTDYAQVDQQRTITDESIAAFFAPLRSKKAALPNKQVFDAQGLRGRLLSSSYTPSPGHDNFAPMLAALGELFDRYQRGGVVSFDYQTVIYYCRLRA